MKERNPARSVPEIMEKRAHQGRLEWIGLREHHRGPIRTVSEAQLLTDCGIAGDRASERTGGKRQVTLIQAEHLPVIAALSGLVSVDPAWLRRNLVVSGMSVLSLRARRFRIGSALLEGTGTCDPCARMEELLGEGGYNAVRGHGGITARVLREGFIRIGDEVDFADDEPKEP